MRCGEIEIEAFLKRADQSITRQLEARGWSAAKGTPGNRRPPAPGSVRLRELDARQGRQRVHGPQEALPSRLAGLSDMLHSANERCE